MSWVAVGVAAVGTGLSIYGATQKNDAIGSSLDANRQAARDELAQQAKINELRVQRARRTAERTMGIVSVSAAERGVGPGGSTAALQRQLAVDAADNQYAIGIEAYGADLRTRMGLENTQRSLASQGQNLLMAGLTGAIQGAQTGLSIGQGIQGAMSSPDLPPLYDVGPPKYLQ